MRPQEIIARKRDGKHLSNDEINYFVSGVTDESWADYQTSALLMAMFVKRIESRRTECADPCDARFGRRFGFFRFGAAESRQAFRRAAWAIKLR